MTAEEAMKFKMLRDGRCPSCFLYTHARGPSGDIIPLESDRSTGGRCLLCHPLKGKSSTDSFCLESDSDPNRHPRKLNTSSSTSHYSQRSKPTSAKSLHTARASVAEGSQSRYNRQDSRTKDQYSGKGNARPRYPEAPSRPIENCARSRSSFSDIKSSNVKGTNHNTSEQRRDNFALTHHAPCAQSDSALVKKSSNRLIKLKFSFGAYEGEFTPSRDLEGYGTMRYNDGSLYEGNWMVNKKDGNGMFRWADGRIYEGGWRKNKRHGKGTFRFIDGVVFHGVWVDDVVHGKGMNRRPDGCVVISDYYEGKAVGVGVCWNSERTQAWRCIKGEKAGKLSAVDAKRTAEGLGFPVPRIRKIRGPVA